MKEAEESGQWRGSPSEASGRGIKMTNYWPDEWFDNGISGMADDHEFKLGDGTVVTGAQVKGELVTDIV